MHGRKGAAKHMAKIMCDGLGNVFARAARRTCTRLITEGVVLGFDSPRGHQWSVGRVVMQRIANP